MIKRYYVKIYDDDETKTVVSDKTGVITQIIIYNDHDENDTNQPTFKLYSDDYNITFVKKKLEPNETFILKLDTYIEDETIKLYSDLKGVQLTFNFLEKD